MGSFRSREPSTLRGGEGGEALDLRSVGRRAAGTYSGALGGRSWRDGRGSWGRRGDVGELVEGVVVAELAGDGWP